MLRGYLVSGEKCVDEHAVYDLGNSKRYSGKFFDARSFDEFKKLR